jgi:tetratricopeptide (TPR) repeat protein
MTLCDAGRLDDADRVLAEAIAHARAQHDQALEARARVEQQFVRFHTGARVRLPVARSVANSAARALAACGDELGECRAWRLRAWIDWTESQAARADEGWQRAAEHAGRAGDERELFEILGWRASAAVFGPSPVIAAIRRCTAIREQVRRSPVAEAVTLRPLGLLYAMRADFDRARRLIRRGNEILDDLGRMQSAVSHHEAVVEMLAGRPAAAGERLRVGYERLEAIGETALLATTAAMLAQAVYDQERYDEAWELCTISASTADEDDVATQVMWRGVRAKLLARQGDGDDAEALAHEAVRLAERTDLLTHHGDALLELADVMQLRGRAHDARVAAECGLELYKRKGNLASVARAQSRLTPATAATTETR